MKNFITTLIFIFIFSHSLYSQMQPPILMFPPNGAINVSTTTVLLWIGSTGALKYRVQLSTNSGFILPLTIDTVIITGYQVPPGRLSYLTQYFWRVNAINNFDTSAWSSVWSFTTLQSLHSAPTLIAPPNGSTGISLTPLLDWNDVPTAQVYRIQLSTNSGFSPAVLDTAGVAVSEFTISSGILLNNTLYYWHVNASNAAGTGQWSSSWVFTTAIVGIGNNNTGMPKEFKLHQNFPNPFNPSTKIAVDIPKSSFISLIVYDILGKEAAMLINENLEPGKYEINWNAVNYPTGIYFYKLTTDEYSETRKMILLK
jgi:hypothetical protein